MTGFTLVELLAVTGILSILAAMMLPALVRACQGARAAACISNLRQIGYAHLEYADMHEGRMVSAYAATDAGSWLNVFYRDILDESAGVFQCPGLQAEARFAAPGVSGRYDVPLHPTYLMNACNAGDGTSGWDTSTIPDKDHTFGWTRGFTGSARNTIAIRRNWVRCPARVLLVAESAATFAALSTLCRSQAGRYVDRYRQTDHGLPILGTAYAAYRNVGDHHNHGFNALFGGSTVKMLYATEDETWAAHTRR